MGEQQWSPGLISSTAIFACGLAVGAIYTAAFVSPDGALDAIGKTQNIFAAVIALGAAFVAYKVQRAKIVSDEAARREDQLSKIHAIRDEATDRMAHILQWMDITLQTFEKTTAATVRMHARGHHEFLGPPVARAARRLDHMWTGLEKAPREQRAGAIQLLLRYETFVEKADDFVQLLGEWKDRPDQAASDLVSHSKEMAKKKLEVLEHHRDMAINS